MDERRYREAEVALWRSVGLEPTEQRVRLAGTKTEVRVQEVGTGDPVLFIHGGSNAGSTWVPMLEHVHGYHCLIVDRPGTGLSDPYTVTAQNLPWFGARFVPDVLDGLGHVRAHVVASSFGGHLALRSAAASPARFGRMVQMAAPAAVPGQTFPPFMRLMRSRTIRTILNVLPPSARANRSIFRQIGHGASLDAGRIPEAVFEWYLALGRYTDTMRHDGQMIGTELMSHLDQVTLTDGLLSSVTPPTLFLWGADDGFGGAANAQRTSGLLPDSELVTMPEAGHLPWLDDPAFTAYRTTEFLGSVADTVDGTSSDTALERAA